MISPVVRKPAHLPLHEWASLRTELIWIYDREVRVQHQQGQGVPLPGYRAWLIRRGTVSIATRARTYSAGPGTWVMPPYHSTDIDFSRNASILSIHFLCQWPSGENILASREGISFKAEKYPALERGAKKLERMLRRQFPTADKREQIYTHQSSDYGSFLRWQELFFRWLATWFHVQTDLGARLTRLTSGDSRPFQAARCLNEAPLDRKFPVERLQQETGLGLMRLNQLFFTEFGMTTRKYWDRRRLELAKQCLETSRMPIKEISYRLGFRSDSHFVIWFRRLTGSRAGDYRRAYLADVAGL
jgi:AraC-like DNA-binding protein